jgi:uncharacterized protein YycO
MTTKSNSFYVCFSKPKKFKIGAWLISKFLNKPYSHTYLEYYSAYHDENIFYESRGVGVRHFGQNEHDKNYCVTHKYEIFVTNTQKKDGMKFLLNISGTKYPFMQNVGIFIHRVLQKFGINIKNPWTKGINCSELVSYYLSHYTDFKMNIDQNLVTPRHVDEFLSQGTFRKIT